VDKNSFFWKIVDGRLPAPPCAKTLGIEFAAIDGERGTAEVKFEAKPEFLNPAGNVQGGFLAAMLDDTMGPALTATLDAGAPTVNLNVQFHRPAGAVAGLVGIECGVVSGVINLESSGVEASDWRLRHDEHYHEARFLAA
jgi:uncharacterized protein (TIGR00369 family)